MLVEYQSWLENHIPKDMGGMREVDETRGAEDGGAMFWEILWQDLSVDLLDFHLEVMDLNIE